MKEIKKKLNLIAKHVNELDVMLKAEYGREAHIYFEAEGVIHAMKAGEQARDESSLVRQSRIIESSNFCRYDCGAW